MSQTTTKAQAHRFTSPWTRHERIAVVAFALAWLLLCRWTPKPCKAWRRRVLRAFRADIHGQPYVAPSAKIRAPWRLRLDHKACLGPHCEVYNLGRVHLQERAVAAQYVYLCGGSHDFNDPKLPLTVADITLGEDCFVGAKAIVLMGVTVGRRAIVGAGAVVAKDIPDETIWAGNPARLLRHREPTAGD